MSFNVLRVGSMGFRLCHLRVLSPSLGQTASEYSSKIYQTEFRYCEKNRTESNFFRRRQLRCISSDSTVRVSEVARTIGLNKFQLSIRYDLQKKLMIRDQHLERAERLLRLAQERNELFHPEYRYDLLYGPLRSKSEAPQQYLNAYYCDQEINELIIESFKKALYEQNRIALPYGIFIEFPFEEIIQVRKELQISDFPIKRVKEQADRSIYELLENVNDFGRKREGKELYTCKLLKLRNMVLYELIYLQEMIDMEKFTNFVIEQINLYPALRDKKDPEADENELRNIQNRRKLQQSKIDLLLIEMDTCLHGEDPQKKYSLNDIEVIREFFNFPIR